MALTVLEASLGRPLSSATRESPGRGGGGTSLGRALAVPDLRPHHPVPHPSPPPPAGGAHARLDSAGDAPQTGCLLDLDSAGGGAAPARHQPPTGAWADG